MVNNRLHGGSSVGQHEWRIGARAGVVDPEVAASVLNRLNKKHGAVTPDAVVKEASKKSSPIHDWFEWDDTEAAKKYRLEQARELIRSVHVTIVGNDEGHTVRAFVHMGRDVGYEDIHTVLSVRDKREEMLARALRELEAFRRKYADLEELASVFAAIEASSYREAA